MKNRVFPWPFGRKRRISADSTSTGVRAAPYRAIQFSPASVTVREESEAVYLSCRTPLEIRHANLIALLRDSVHRFGDQPFIHERPEPGAPWHGLSFATFEASVARDGGRLIELGVGRGDRVVILARNSIAHLSATFAVMALGAVAVPLSPLYLAHPTGAALLAELVRTVGAKLMLVDGDILPACAAMDFDGRAIELQGLPALPGGVLNLAQAEATVMPGDAAKILFTSGSTGTPKPVVNTHAMLTAAASMLSQIGPKPVDGVTETAVDWLPWHHAYGGNVNVHGALLAGARLFIDAGMPTPAGLPVTLANLADVGPTVLTTVPAAFGPMLATFRADPALARAVFKNLTRMSFGGAALAASVIDAYQNLAVELTGARIQFGSGYGMTETCGILALVHWPSDRGDLLGLPVPGVEMKLVPLDGDRFECRVRGPNVFDGYPGHGAQPFDEDGFFITGDAVQPADPDDWSQGLIFAGRVAEDFKLANGVWVRSGNLRAEALERLGPLALDAVLVGESRNEIGLLVLGAPGVDDDRIRQRLAGTFEGRSASTRIARAALLKTPPDPQRGEITAKGSLNVARVTQNRAAEIAALFADDATCLSPVLSV
jgi:feruloyl-CoA synthase